MLKSGLLTVGCHSCSHPFLSQLDRSEVTEEVSLARDRIAQELGATPRYFAYPYGEESAIGPDAAAVVAEAGFHAAFGTRRAMLCKSDLASPYMLPRISIDGRFQYPAALSAYFLMAEHGW
jgi:peptidoglycan/xylan/chitin deacetylase (PgdA/CDA1 family)